MPATGIDAPWPADAVTRRPLAEIVPYAANARLHSDAQIDQIAASMREWGFTIPVLLDERGEIIAGHGRVLAAQRIGLESVPVMVARGWTPKQIKAYRIADNQIALNSAWDVKLLAAELGDLPGMAELIGFPEGALESILAGGAVETRPLPSPEDARRTLADRFGLPPFSVLNAREGWWQERKRAWIAIGIESELGRGENLLRFSDTINQPDPAKRAAARAIYPGQGQDLVRQGYQRGAVVNGKGWAEGGPARRDAAFYTKKRAWEKENGRRISTTEFREKHWNGGA